MLAVALLYEWISTRVKTLMKVTSLTGTYSHRNGHLAAKTISILSLLGLLAVEFPHPWSMLGKEVVST